MASIKRFEDFDFWQLSRDLNKQLLKYIECEKFSRDFKLLQQISGSCGSIMDNIAEGFERGGNKELIQFLSYSKGSCGEFKSQLYRVLDKKYITPDQFEESYNLANQIAGKISGFIQYLSKSDFKGWKYNIRNENPKS